MKFHTEYVTFNTRTERDYINMTARVESAVKASGCREGMVLVSAMHITAGVYVNDAEQGLIQDIDEWLDTLAPPRPDYRHHRTGETNGDSHLKDLLLGHEVDPPHHGRPAGPGAVAAGLLRGVRREAAEARHHQGDGGVAAREGPQVRRQLRRRRGAHQERHRHHPAGRRGGTGGGRPLGDEGGDRPPGVGGAGSGTRFGNLSRKAGNHPRAALRRGTSPLPAR